MLSGITALLAAASLSYAGPVGPLTTFSAGTPARASDVNGNFSAVSTAVNDNASRITTLQSIINTFGTANTFVGLGAGNLTMSGIHNTASGFQALGNNTTGNSNTASGVSALTRNTTGNVNTASGSGALSFNTTGSQNTASGASALFSNTTGSQNTASGELALSFNTTGTANIAIGFNAGSNLTTGDNNIDIGNAGVADEVNTIRIGTSQIATFVAGVSGATSASGVMVLVNSSGQLGTTTSSRRFKQNIADMGDTTSRLMRLRPVTFHYKPGHDDGSRLLQYGLIAEEVAAVYPGLVASAPDGKAQTVRYHFLTPMLLNEYQKQQRTIEAQTVRIAQLEKQNAEIAELKAQLTRMAAMLGRLEQTRMVANASR